MNIYSVYEDKYQLEETRFTHFDAHRKAVLNEVDEYGLEYILQAFIKNYEENIFGEAYTDISNYTRFSTDNVNILDGCTDTYVFDGYAIDSIWMTDNGCVILECREIGEIEDVCSIDIYDYPRVLFVLN